MEREEEKPKAFTVNDRRRFSSEGDLKPEFRDREDQPPPPAPDAADAAATPDAGAQAESPAQDTHAHPTEDAGHTAHEHLQEHPHEHDHQHDLAEEHTHDAPHDHHAHRGAPAEMSFGTFLVGLSTQALMLLGDIPDPQTGKPDRDLVGAQQLIDIIGMLEQKTQGNLDRDEAQLIKSVLFELRMKYVEKSRPSR